jgi:hypothetical protein
MCEKAVRSKLNVKRELRCGRGLPEKTIAKNFVSLTTYPHSDREQFENRLAKQRT